MGAYTEALLVATPTTLLVESKKPATLTGLTQEQMGKMERKMSNLQGIREFPEFSRKSRKSLEAHPASP